MTIAAGLAAFCSQAGTEPLPAAVQRRAQLCVADHLNAAMWGARTETASRLMRYLDPDSGSPTPAAEAVALLLGAASTVYEIDDVHHDTSMHTGSAVVSTALGSLAEMPSSGHRLLAAIAAGYEVAIRVSIAAGERHYQYFHSTATCGTIAAAATAAIMYRLDQEQTSHAMGLAATSASGLWEGINDEAVGVKHLHSGFAAERGIRAAKLARLGLRAARRSIEGERGFLAALAGRPSLAPREAQEILLAGLGESWMILRNIFKRYPFCLACFEPLEGIRHLLETGSHSIGDVRSVLVALYPRSASIVGQSDPQNQLQAKFSAAFAVAIVLAGHNPEDVTLPEAWLVDPAVRRWYPNIRVLADRTVPRRHARVTVGWNDGTEQCADRPLLSLSELEAWSRFASTCRQFGGSRAGALEAVVAGAADLKDTIELFTLVRAAVGI
jgi:2-methylcitrate dehydratase PrpD